ncbi:MAG: polysaccharide deacetylase family protein [Gaiellaceae bacterium]
MYHYVRDGARVHARTTAELEGQLDHVAAAYEVVGLAAVRDGDLPENACLLTFDDGLVEHLETVAPALRRRGLSGCFCPPARPVLERSVLDVQKTQFLLAASDDHGALARRILDLARPYGVASDEELRARNTPPHRFDPPETVFVKRVLQDGLPEGPRREILDRLFAELVSDDERSFADGLYLTLDGVRELAAMGLDVAGHGYSHRRLGLLDEDAQRDEIARTRDFLGRVSGDEPAGWTMCYPYGSRDGTTLRLLREAGCALGLTTDVGLAGSGSDPLQLPRIDTNDLPVEVVERPRVDRPVAEAP